MSWLLALSILGVYLVQLVCVRHDFDPVGTALAIRPQVWAQHRFFTLLTYAWAHAIPLRGVPFYAAFHLVANIGPLACLAPGLERRCGPWWLVLLFCGGAVAAALTWLAARPLPGDAMIGASGAVFALITAAALLNLRAWTVDLFWLRFSLRMNMRQAAVILCALEVVLSFWRGMPGVAHTAHLGGALFGVLFACVARLQLR